MSGYGMSGLIFNNLSLYLVNPQRESAGPDGLFPESVYKNVPHMLRYLSYVYALLILIAVVLVFPGPEKKENEAVEIQTETQTSEEELNRAVLNNTTSGVS